MTRFRRNRRLPDRCRAREHGMREPGTIEPDDRQDRAQLDEDVEGLGPLVQPEPSHSLTTMRCPVDDTGMNSVAPSTRPRMTALSSISGDTQPAHSSISRYSASYIGTITIGGELVWPWRSPPRASRRGARDRAAAPPPADPWPPPSPPARGCRSRRRPPPRAARRLGWPRRATPQAIASSAARPNDSVCEGSRKRSLACSSDATESSRPRNRTSPLTSRSRASFSASTRSGPSPIITSVAGIARRIRANTRTTSLTRFTSRKFET